MTTALEVTDKDFERMMQMLTGFFVTQIARAVATYSIADHLAKGPATANQIATIEGIDSTATFRLLRACASLGLVSCDDGLTFSSTPLLGTLRANVPGSLHSLAIAWSAPGHWLPWGKFLDAIRTGPAADRSGTRCGDLGLLRTTARRGRSFHQCDARSYFRDSARCRPPGRYVESQARSRYRRCKRHASSQSDDWQSAVAWHHLGSSGCVPSATVAAAALGLAERSSVLAGDFFTSVPEADLYLLKLVLHDWNDGQGVCILENCRRAMRPGGRVIVIEKLLGEMGEPGPAPFTDLNMMVMLPGRERTLSEYRALLKQAGFRLDKSTPIRPPTAVIEAVAA